MMSAGGAGGASSGAAASIGSLGSLPAEATLAIAQGDEAALLAWLDSGGQVNATCKAGDRSGVEIFVGLRATAKSVTT